MPKVARVFSTPPVNSSKIPSKPTDAILECALEDILSMSDLANHLLEEAFGLEAGNVTVDARSKEMISFSVYLLRRLIKEVHGRYHGE